MGHHHSIAVEKLSTIYIVCFALNLFFVIIEATTGILADSMGLISDAGHNLGDVFALLLSMIALRLTMSHGRKNYTYGYRKSSVLISLLNAIILAIAVGIIAFESIEKFFHPTIVNSEIVILTAFIGIIINGGTAIALSRSHGHDLSTRGAYLHMLADTLVSVGVVVSGFIISQTGWYVIDPIIGLIIAIIILFSTWNLLTESLRLSVDAVPAGINSDAISNHIERISGVVNVHHVHIWPISTIETALTAHIVVEDMAYAEDVIVKIKEMLAVEGITHSTIEAESFKSCCSQRSCC